MQVLFISIYRKVRKTEGLKVSRVYPDCLFSEVSARDGRNVDQAMTDLARVLKENQDRDMRKAKTITLGNDDNLARSRKSGLPEMLTKTF